MRPIPLILALLLATPAIAAPGDESESTRAPDQRPGAWSRPPRAPELAPAAAVDSLHVGLLSRRWSPMDAQLRLAYPSTGGGGHASPHDLLGLTPRTRPLTTLERFAYSADKGAFAGLALGTLGEWSGVWEERTAWALMGAGAALGVLWGGIGDDDAGITIRPSLSVGADDEP